MVERYFPKMDVGLTTKQIKSRMKNGLVNDNISVPSKSIKKIFCDNILTLFNLLNLAIAIALFLVDSYKNTAFLGVVFCNVVISTFQEIRSKRIIDKLSVISSSKVEVIRDAKKQLIDLDELVLDDIVIYKLGNQVVADSIIMDGLVEVDESFITGEAEAIAKKTGDMLLSGSFIVSGNAIGKIEHINEDNYTSKISKEATYIKKINSEIMKTLNKFIKIISIVIVPLGIILFLRQYGLSHDLTDAVVSTSAAIISMIPEGLILLTSTVLAVSTIRLAKRKVLTQELYCIETLARVDTICLDKTGTITEGSLEIADTVTLDSDYNLEEVMNAIAYYNRDNNATSLAIKNKYKDKTKWQKEDTISFSSIRKYSGITFNKEGTYLIGAPECLPIGSKYIDIISEYQESYRVLVIAHTMNYDHKLPVRVKAIGLLLIKDKIRYKAVDTLNFFKKQGVDVKLISGDSVKTVARIANEIGLKDIRSIDLSNLDDNEDLVEIVEKYNLFGRVTPIQKKKLILALKERGHTVAMTGDGVNDVLALKEADCSIAMATGSEAARNVSQLVLLNSDFAAIPKIVLEGRRAINNIERSATLFITKTIYSTLLAILFLFISMNYPFQPIQLSLNSVVTIGIPSFILALEPNKERIHGRFIINILRRALPAAIIIVLNIMIVMLLSHIFSFSDDRTSTMALCTVTFAGFMLLFKLCYPFNLIRKIMYVSLVMIFLGSAIVFHSLFDIILLSPFMFLLLGSICLLNIPLFKGLTNLSEKKLFKYEERIIR